MNKVLIYFAEKKIGDFTTEVQCTPKRRTGHFDLSIYLKNAKSQTSKIPLFKGLFSKGNTSRNIQPWFDFHFSDAAVFSGEKNMILSQRGSCAEQAFHMIEQASAPGGMIFVSLVTDLIWDIPSSIHSVTRECLSLRSLSIPPAATPLGHLIFEAGFLNVKSQGFDVQGSSRLAGEKAFSPEAERSFSRKIKADLTEYLQRNDPLDSSGLHRICRAHAEYALKKLA